MAEASVAVLVMSRPRVRWAALMSSSAPLPFAGSAVSSTTSIVTGLRVSGSTGQALVLDSAGLLGVVVMALEDEVDPDEELVPGLEDVPSAGGIVGVALLLAAEADDDAADLDGEVDDDVAAGSVVGVALLLAAEADDDAADLDGEVDDDVAAGSVVGV